MSGDPGRPGNRSKRLGAKPVLCVSLCLSVDVLYLSPLDVNRMIVSLSLDGAHVTISLYLSLSLDGETLSLLMAVCFPYIASSSSTSSSAEVVGLRASVRNRGSRGSRATGSDLQGLD